MSKLCVDLYSEDTDECFASFNVEDVSEIKEMIQGLEEDTGETSDFVLIFNEGTEASQWYILDEEMTLYEADEELSEGLDELYSDNEEELSESNFGWFLDFLKEEYEDLENVSEEELHERVKRRVSSTGKVKRVRDRKTRRRQATKTTGLSRSALKRRARKASKTKRRNPGGQRKATKKRRKAMRKRRQMGVR